MSAHQTIQLRKAARVMGKTLVFRDAGVEDAAFIFSLRTDSEKSRFLSAVSNDLADQQAWLVRYAKLTDQAYFIIEYQNQPIGTVRLYDPQGESFCWGSWILHNNRPNNAAMESALMIYSYAIDHLGFRAAHFDVRKENVRVWKFHERFGAHRIAESKFDYYYTLDIEAISSSRNRYQRFLDRPVRVDLL